MFVYAFTTCMESGYRTAFRKHGATLKQMDLEDLELFEKRKPKKDAIYYLASGFPGYSKVLGHLLDNGAEKMILELPEYAMMENMVMKSNMVFIPAHSHPMILEAALMSLSFGEKTMIPRKMVWGDNPKMMRIRSMLPKISHSDVSIHISGEVGTGKNAIADEIARLRGMERAVYINCASLSSELADDMLFGHAKGAYTNATESRQGLCKDADGGILFLDELQDLPLEAQSKLLHLLETGLYRPYGSNREEHSKFKIITSSSLPIDDLKKKIRADFMSRIGTIVLHVPPLRERIGDMEQIIDTLMENRGFSEKPTGLEIEKMKRYKWPGNIRELSKVLEYYDNLEELPERIMNIQ